MENRFILGDCMNPETGLPSFPDNYFDLAIVDPPYENTFTTGGCIDNLAKKGDYKTLSLNGNLPTAKYWKELIRVSKNQIIWGANYFGNMPKTRCWVVWDKDNSGNYSDCELAYTSFNSAVRKAKFKWNGMLQQDMKNKEHRIHPTQKPVALYRWLLDNYAKPSDLILDTHVGSASSLIACESMGFNYVGYEIDPDYYAAAKKRMVAGIQKAMF